MAAREIVLGALLGTSLTFIGAVATTAVAQEAPPAPPAVPPGTGAAAPEEEVRYFEAPAPEWTFDWGTDTTFTLSNREAGSTNETNDGTTPFDALWLRLYGHLRYGQRAELVVDLFATESHAPSLYGLYGKIELHRHFGLRAGLLPLVFGAWQERAYPSLQPLIGAPLHSQYLLGVHNGALPSNVESLRYWREPGYEDQYDDATGNWAGLAYEHCWDTGVEVFGEARGLRYRIAAMDGTPGLPAAPWRLEKDGGSLQARLTYQVVEAVRIGGSAAVGSYLLNTVRPWLPEGTESTDYRQDLVGADLRVEHGPVTVVADYVFSRFDSPFASAGADPARADLDTHAYSAEIGFDVAPGLTLAGRVSGMHFGTVERAGAGGWWTTPPYGEAPSWNSGGTVAWDDDVTRIEAGARYRFWESIAVKAVYQHTRVDAEPRRTEDLGALQLVFSH